MKRIIAIEGMPGAGKTTLISNIMKNGFLGNSVFLPQLEIKNYLGDDIKASKLYLDAEKDKNDSVKKLLKNNNNVLLDRTFITTLAYCYARSCVKKDPEQYKQLNEYFRLLFRNDYFIRPDIIICLDISISESISRRIDFINTKGCCYWFDPIFLGYFRNFYLKNINQFGCERIFILNSTNIDERDLLKKTKKLLNLL